MFWISYINFLNPIPVYLNLKLVCRQHPTIQQPRKERVQFIQTCNWFSTDWPNLVMCENHWLLNSSLRVHALRFLVTVLEILVYTQFHKRRTYVSFFNWNHMKTLEPLMFTQNLQKTPCFLSSHTFVIGYTQQYQVLHYKALPEFLSTFTH